MGKAEVAPRAWFFAMVRGRRDRVESFFRDSSGTRGWVPATATFVGLLGVSLATLAWAHIGPPGAWALFAVELAAYALAAFLLGWPRVLGPAIPALAVDAAASHTATVAMVPAGAEAGFQPELAALRVGTAALLTGLVGVGGTAWLWDRVRRVETRVQPGPWAAALVAPAALLAAVAWLVPADWIVSPVAWGYAGRSPTALTTIALGLGLAVALAWSLGRWRRGAAFTFVDRFLAAGLPLVLVEAILIPLSPLADQGFPVVEDGMLSFTAQNVLRSGLHGAGEAYLAAALAAGAAALVLPERYAELEEDEEAEARPSG
jgi:hypothetical protein